ncbi:hypothetical protein E3U43_004595 [Larimichthys crocea]|uniref:Uncharacterized protein n=1 Tax=Larimichthys crocea TaxID=215358 RepID=A0ACD3QDX8_LARCR|nr:hypothetical protein E3U43_004595 [Larimichthys crocea]
MTAPSFSLLLGLIVLLFGLTVSADHSVFLEYPNPAIAGNDVTLRCKTRDSSTNVGYFFRNGSFFGYSDTGEFTINNVQHSDEGLYWCSTGLFSQSSKIWLSVKDPDPSSLLLVRLLCHLVVVSLYFTSTILMVSIYCGKRKGATFVVKVSGPAQRNGEITQLHACFLTLPTGNNTAITMETDSRVEGGQGQAANYDYVTAVYDF